MLRRFPLCFYKLLAYLTQRDLRVVIRGFRLTKNGIFPGTDKLKAVKEAKPPRKRQTNQAISGPVQLLSRAHSKFRPDYFPSDPAYQKGRLMETGQLTGARSTGFSSPTIAALLSASVSLPLG